MATKTKHSIKAEYTNDWGQKSVDCSCGAHVDNFEAHLLAAHQADVAANAHAEALKAAHDWNKAD